MTNDTYCYTCFRLKEGKTCVPRLFITEETETRININTGSVVRTKHGEKEACSDCGVLIHQYHHWGCGLEPCQLCQGKAFTCGCYERAAATALDDVEVYELVR